MRRTILFAILAACAGHSDTLDETYVGNGGMIAISDCGYTITTRDGADAPKLASDGFGPDSTPRLVHLGIVGDAKTSMVVQWRTADEKTLATRVKLGAGANLTVDQLTDTRTGIEFGYKSSGMTVFRQHQAHLCNLQPGTTYSYQIVGSDAAHSSPVYTFHTAPDVTAKPDAEVVFGFVGDSRGGYDVWTQLVAQIQQRTPDLILFSGDAVTFGITQDEWEEFFGDAESLFSTVPLVSADGNHEDNAVNYYSQVALPGDQENFGIDYGFAHITVANDTPEDPAAIAGAFHDAISADLTASDGARWKLFMNHQPFFSASMHGPTVTLQQAWQPLLDAHHVDLVLNGHEHDFEITKPLVGMTVQTTTANATVYVVAGGAGAELYPSGNQFWTQYSESAHSAAVIHVSSGMMTLDSFHPDGTAIPTGFMKTKP